MASLASAFGDVRVLVPVSDAGPGAGAISLTQNRIGVVPLVPLLSRGVYRKLVFPFWLLRNLPTILRELRAAEAVHAPIPGDVGTVGMLLAWAVRKPLLVRHCGNWIQPRTTAEKFWRWFMEKYAGGRNVMLATGGSDHCPSTNPNVRWIFSSSLTEAELRSIGQVRTAPTQGNLRLVHVARQETAKGSGVIIEALPLLTSPFTNVHLDIVGEGSALSGYRSRVAELGLTGRVTFHGKLGHEEVIAKLQQAHLFCYPTSASEGFPKVVIEALATGLPVIATPVSVLPQLMSKGGGMLIEQAKPELVAAAISQAVFDPEGYTEMSRKAIQTASGYSLEAWGTQIRELCRSAWGF